jgi:hypothetical protein
MGTILVILAVQQSSGSSALGLLAARPVQAVETISALQAQRPVVDAVRLLRVEVEMQRKQPGGVPSTAIGTQPRASHQQTWRGSAARQAYVRTAPSRKAKQIGELLPDQPVEVVGWVNGDEVERDNSTWADLGEGRYVYSAALRREALASAPTPPGGAPASGRWIDVNLTLQTATAYDGATPLKTVLITSGRPGWDTARGLHKVERRVERETMDGATLIGQGPDGAGARYKLGNVRWTQYFSPDGSAIHENYWRNPASFGLPGSHGCIGMLPTDAAWFWSFANLGTPIVIH